MIHHFMKCTISLLVMWLMLLTSCNSSKEVLYFQDLKSGNSVAVTAEAIALKIQPEDKISIIVNSRDPQLMALFNLPRVNKQMGTMGSVSSTTLSSTNRARCAWLYSR